MRALALAVLLGSTMFAGSSAAIAAAASTPRAGETIKDCDNCPEMVVVPAGEFMMGTLPRHQVPTEVPAEVNPVKVRVRQAFALGRFEVTRAEYAEFARSTGRAETLVKCRTWVESVQGFRDLMIRWDAPNVPQNALPRHPATCIDWHDARAYAQWLSEKTGRHYRLPTEAEWEYAAKAGTVTLRYWGDDPNRGCKYANLNDLRTRARYPLAWAGIDCDDGFEDVAPVGSLAPNAFGLYDMIGNVWEWAEDCSTLTYHGRPLDERAWLWDGGCTRKIQRAGGWSTGPERARASFHGDGTADDRADFAGFRVALDLTPREESAAAVAAPKSIKKITGDSAPSAGSTLRDCDTCPVMTVIAPGKFSLGTSTDEYEHDVESGETPPLSVDIRDVFALGKFEVRHDEFSVFVTRSGYRPVLGCALSNDRKPDEPARCITKRDAEAYVEWLGKTTGKKYRLPSESEWEYAARAGKPGARFWSSRDSHEGVSISRACDFANVYDVSARALQLPYQFARCTDGQPGPASVGTFLPNEFGLHDMIGNVRELVADCHTRSYKGRPPNESAWVWSGCFTTVLRGGSWLSRPFASRSAARDGEILDAPEARWLDVGFRVARDL